MVGFLPGLYETIHHYSLRSNIGFIFFEIIGLDLMNIGSKRVHKKICFACGHHCWLHNLYNNTNQNALVKLITR
jgi:hypothetical protein